MQAFTQVTSGVAVIAGDNCDTDQILPGRFLKEPRGPDYGRFLFHDLRRDAAGNLRADFPLNRDDSPKILLVGENFGCGSSREGAVYALVDGGIRALIGPSFGDILYNNALKNGLLPIVMPQAQCQALAAYLQHTPQAQVCVDLQAGEVILPHAPPHPIRIDAFARDCILQGLDELELTQTMMTQILAFEGRRLEACPWLDR